jgi:dipeptidyl aminopeptidase/acylaminoacyl peptidase
LTRARFIALGVFLTHVLTVRASAVEQAKGGPTFDARPVDLPKIEKTPRSLVSSSDLLAIRDLHGIAISPNGKYVAFVVGQAVYEINGYRTGLFVVGTEPGSQPRSLGSAGMPHWDEINQWPPEPPQWSPDSQSITYRARWSSQEPWQVWRWDRSGGPPRLVAKFAGDVVRYDWDAAKNQILLTVEKPRSAAESEKARRSLMEQGIAYDEKILAWTGASVLDQVLAHDPRKTELWIHDCRKGINRRATQKETAALNATSAGFEEQLEKKLPGQVLLDQKRSPDGNAVVFRTWTYHPPNRNYEQRTLFLVTKSNDVPVELTPGAYYVDEYWWSPDGSILYYTEFSGDGRPRQLKALRLGGGNPEVVSASPDALAEFSVDRRGRYAACTRENATTPAQVALFDLATRSVRILADVNPELQNIELGSSERVEGTNHFGDAWHGHLVKPADYRAGRRYPLIVTLYRSGDAVFLRGATGDEFPIQVFAAQGFAVLSFDVGMNKTFSPGDFEGFIRTRYASALASLEMAIQNLIDRGIVEPGAVGICGLSRGTETVEYAITHSDLFQAAAASGGGGRDPYFYYMSGKSWRRQFADWGLAGWPEGMMRSNWQELSLSLRANLVKAPLLINAADSEFVPSLSTYTALKELNKTVELYIYPGELHIKNQPKHRFEIYNRNLQWFERWLKNRETRPGDSPASKGSTRK